MGQLNGQLHVGVPLTHGHTVYGKPTQEYQSWVNMRSRCDSTRDISYKNYGARGIKVCRGFSGPDGFANFLVTVGFKPTSRHTIDRKNNNGHYSCGKCEQCLANGWNMNLRWTTRSVQNHNRRPRKGASSKYKGVSFFKITGRWVAKIVQEGRNYHLGYFDKEEDAAIAYDLAAIKHFGEFAVLNLLANPYDAIPKAA